MSLSSAQQRVADASRTQRPRTYTAPQQVKTRQPSHSHSHHHHAHPSAGVSGSPPLRDVSFVPDSMSSACFACKSPFTFTRRRHHCRSCGNVCCSSCSSKRIVLPPALASYAASGHKNGQAAPAPVRVCDACFSMHQQREHLKSMRRPSMPAHTTATATGATGAHATGGSSLAACLTRDDSEGAVWDQDSAYQSGVAVGGGWGTNIEAGGRWFSSFFYTDPATASAAAAGGAANTVDDESATRPNNGPNLALHINPNHIESVAIANDAMQQQRHHPLSRGNSLSSLPPIDRVDPLLSVDQLSQFTLLLFNTYLCVSLSEEKIKLQLPDIIWHTLSRKHVEGLSGEADVHEQITKKAERYLQTIQNAVRRNREEWMRFMQASASAAATTSTEEHPPFLAYPNQPPSFCSGTLFVTNFQLVFIPDYVVYIYWSHILSVEERRRWKVRRAHQRRQLIDSKLVNAPCMAGGVGTLPPLAASTTLSSSSSSPSPSPSPSLSSAARLHRNDVSASSHTPSREASPDSNLVSAYDDAAQQDREDGNGGPDECWAASNRVAGPDELRRTITDPTPTPPITHTPSSPSHSPRRASDSSSLSVKDASAGRLAASAAAHAASSSPPVAAIPSPNTTSTTATNTNSQSIMSSSIHSSGSSSSIFARYRNQSHLHLPHYRIYQTMVQGSSAGLGGVCASSAINSDSGDSPPPSQPEFDPLLFSPPFLTVPLLAIRKTKSYSYDSKDLGHVEVKTKLHHPTMRFILANLVKKQRFTAFKNLGKCIDFYTSYTPPGPAAVASPECMQKVFAFRYAATTSALSSSSSSSPSHAPTIDVGWTIYQPLNEFHRMGLIPAPNAAPTSNANGNTNGAPTYAFRVTELNKSFQYSPSYPRYLIVPALVTDDALASVASFRSKRRIPCVCWSGPLPAPPVSSLRSIEIGLAGLSIDSPPRPNGIRAKRALLLRSAQPLTGLTGQRCTDDEMLLQHACAAVGADRLLIVDCRPMANAIGQAALGAGYENASLWYTPPSGKQPSGQCVIREAQIQFLNVENIHAVRKTHASVEKLVSKLAEEEADMEFAGWRAEAGVRVRNDTRSGSTNNQPAAGAMRTVQPAHAVQPVAVPFPTPHPLAASWTASLHSSGHFGHLTNILAGVNQVLACLSQGICVLAHCIPAADHQILTDEGFLDLKDVLARAPQLDPAVTPSRTDASDQLKPLLFATFNPTSKKLEYLPATRLVLKDTDELIEFTSECAAAAWGHNSDEYGRSLQVARTEYAANTSSDSNGFSLLVTPDHDMYARVGHTHNGMTEWAGSSHTGQRDRDILPPTKMKANALVSTDAAHAIEMFCRAPGGVHVPKSPPLPFIEKLNLQGPEAICAFLELYGLWLCVGSFSADATGITFHPHKRSDIPWITNQIRTMGWDSAECTEDTCTLTIARAHWVEYFLDQYNDDNSNESDGVQSMKCCLPWVWRLEQKYLRAILTGMRRASGSEATDRNEIITSSVRLRDDIMRMCIHAGYSAIFNIADKKETQSGGAIDPHDLWCVSYHDSIESCSPTLHTARDVKRVSVPPTRVWCVTVPPHNLIIARRVARNQHGVITKASRPTIIGNCSDGWDRTSILTSLAQLSLDSYSRTIEGFIVLIEKEWLHFGHRFADRLGHGHFNHEVSPIMLQFLDCVYQYTIQFPTAFQFDQRLLLYIHYHLYAGFSGTFLFNSEEERCRNNASEKTRSVWSYVIDHLSEFSSPLYGVGWTDVARPIPNRRPTHPNFATLPLYQDSSTLYIDTKAIVLWDEMYLGARKALIWNYNLIPHSSLPSSSIIGGCGGSTPGVIPTSTPIGVVDNPKMDLNPITLYLDGLEKQDQVEAVTLRLEKIEVESCIQAMVAQVEVADMRRTMLDRLASQIASSAILEAKMCLREEWLLQQMECEIERRVADAKRTHVLSVAAPPDFDRHPSTPISSIRTGARPAPMTQPDPRLQPRNIFSSSSSPRAPNFAPTAATPAARRGITIKERSQWQKDTDTCAGCKAAFSMVRRRHHCRVCGGVRCDSCCPKTEIVSERRTAYPTGRGEESDRLEPEKQVHRVCTACMPYASEVTRAYDDDVHAAAVSSAASMSTQPPRSRSLIVRSADNSSWPASIVQHVHQVVCGTYFAPSAMSQPARKSSAHDANFTRDTEEQQGKHTERDAQLTH